MKSHKDAAECGDVGHVAGKLLVEDGELPGTEDIEHIDQLDLRKEAAFAVASHAGAFQRVRVAQDAVPVEHGDASGGQISFHVHPDALPVRPKVPEDFRDPYRAEGDAGADALQEGGAAVEVHAPERALLPAFQQRQDACLPPAVGEQALQALPHGGGEGMQEGRGPVFPVLHFQIQRGQGRCALAWLQPLLGDRPKATSGLLPLPLALPVMDAEALVEVPVAANVLCLPARAARIALSRQVFRPCLQSPYWSP